MVPSCGVEPVLDSIPIHPSWVVALRKIRPILGHLRGFLTQVMRPITVNLAVERILLLHATHPLSRLGS